MALGAGISAFVNGFVAGEDIEHRWQDRKDDKARQKKLDEYRADAEKRLAERHGWDRTNQGIYVDQQGRIATEWDQQQADRAGIRGAAADAVAAADAAWNTAPVDAAPVARVSTKGPAMGAMPTLRGNTPLIQTDPSYDSPATPRPSITVGQTPQAAAPRSAAMGVQPNPQQVEGDVMLPPIYDNGQIAPPDTRDPSQPYQYGQPGRARQDIQQAARGVGDTVAGWGEQVVNSGIDTLQRVNAPFQAASRWMTGEDHIGAPERVDLNNDGQRPTVEGPVGDVLFGRREAAAPTPKDATPQEAAVSRSAQDAMDRVGQEPSQQATANAMPASMGATKGKPMTEPQRKKAAKTYTDTWMQVGAPIYQRELLKQGRIDDAKAMDDWMRTSETRTGMEAFSEATFAAMMGDSEKAAEKIIEAYNTTGYFDDGYEIMKDQSELIRDGNGEVVGLKLAMRNQATGEVVESIDEIDDLLNKALYLISPEKAFEAAIARQTAMSEALVKAESDRAAAGRDLIKTDHADANKAALELFKADQANAALEGRQPITWQEALAAVNQQTSAGASGNVPVLRPQ